MIILLFIFGVIIGSFLNCVIYRLPRGISFVTGRSFCPKCKHTLSWYDNIPLLSFLLLFGRCRYCRKKISWRYPTIEALTGFLFAVAFLTLSGLANLVVGLFIVSAMILIFFIDLEHFIIPDKIIYSASVVVIFWRILNQQLTTSNVLNYLFSAIAIYLFFRLIILLTKGKGMGMGDAKLGLLIGLELGYPLSIVSLYLAFLTGAFVGVILILGGKKKIGQVIPFGPFLSASLILTLFWGDILFKWIAAHLF